MRQQPLRALAFFDVVPYPPLIYMDLQGFREGCNRKFAAFVRKFIFSPENPRFLPAIPKKCPQNVFQQLFKTIIKALPPAKPTKKQSQKARTMRLFCSVTNFAVLLIHKPHLTF
ncbi:hypothetical protein ACFFJY_00155 [Fictibacillus aquaticus]|uniref:Uncharacterized protein n=1 Tax=Fictibacillus aquaticus TaxID=2021314 RepID=A0A235F833_9BACL|nr:hypothetical protein [Fictibacillus aquaticus]OYD57147.1 hypothetical protein CGZ90_10640 [Fictibacillus aquaticus]